MAKKKKEESWLDKIKNTVTGAISSAKDAVSDLFDGDDKKATSTKSPSSASKSSTAKKANTTSTTSAKSVSVPRPTTTLANSTSKVLNTAKKTPSVQKPVLKAPNVATVSSSPKIKQMSENSAKWNQLEIQKKLPNANVAALTQKQQELHNQNAKLAGNTLKFNPSGVWKNPISGQSAYSIGKLDNNSLFLPYLPSVETLKTESKVAETPVKSTSQLNLPFDPGAKSVIIGGKEYKIADTAVPYVMSSKPKNALDEVADFAKWIKDNTIAGVTGASAALTKTADLILPDFLTPKVVQDYFASNAAYADEKKAKASETNSQGGNISNIAGEIYQAGVQMIPSAIAALASGGTSALGQTGSAVSNLVSSPAFWTSFAQTAGPEYYNAKAKGANELQASLTGVTSGAIGGAIERMGGIDTLLGNKAQGILRTAAEEAGEEVLQDISSGLINKAAYDYNRDWFGTGDSDAVINPQRLAMSAAAGGILGGAVSGVNAAINGRGANTNANDTLFPPLGDAAEYYSGDAIAYTQNIDSISELSRQPLTAAEQRRINAMADKFANLYNMAFPYKIGSITDTDFNAAKRINNVTDISNTNNIVSNNIVKAPDMRNTLNKNINRTSKIDNNTRNTSMSSNQTLQFDALANAENHINEVMAQNATNSQSETVGQIIDNAIADAQVDTNKSNMDIDETSSETITNDLLASWQEVKALDKQIAAFEDRVNFTGNDLRQIESSLLSGDTSTLYRADNPQDALYMVELKAKRNAARQPIDDYRKQYQDKLWLEVNEDAEVFFKYAKDKVLGLQYATETPERNIYDIFGKKFRAYADDFIKRYYTPVHKAVAKGNQLKNQFRDRVRSLNLTQEESVLTQYLLEGKTDEYNQYITANKIKLTDVQNNKIAKAAVEFRAIYDELFHMINEAEIRNGLEPTDFRQLYAPHFTEKLSDHFLARILNKIGFTITKKDQIPTSISGITENFRPKKQWFKHSQRRTGEQTIVDAVRGFDQYIDTACDVITLTDSIQRFRQLEDAIRYQFTDASMKKLVENVMADDTLSYLQRQQKLDEIYENNTSNAERINNLSGGNMGLRNFVAQLRKYTDNLAGKKSRGDRSVEDDTNRTVYEVSKQVQSRVSANMIAGNISSWLTNVIPLTQATGEIDIPDLLRGMRDTIKSYVKDDGFVDGSAFLTNRRGSKNILQTKVQKVGNALGSPMEFIDQFVADSIVRGRTHQNIKKGMDLDAAIDEADAMAASLMADRSKGATPEIFNRQSPITKVFTTFQIEVNNQLRYLGKDIPRRLGEHGAIAVGKALTSVFVGAYLYNELYEKLTGRRAALDPVGMIKDTLNIIDNEESENSDKIQDVATLYAQQLPFVGGLLGGGRLPISAALPDVGNLLTAFNSDVPTKKRVDIVAGELTNPAAYLLLPFGGGAVKKGIEGYNLIHNKGAYRVNDEGEDELMFAAPGNSAGDYIKSMMFGQYSNENAQNYIDSGFKVLDSEYTQKYKKLISDDYGIDNNTAYDALMAVANAPSDEKRAVLMNTPLPADAKSYLDWSLFSYADSGNHIDYSDKDHFNITTQIDSDFLDNALYLYDNLGLNSDEVINLIKTSSFESTYQVGSKKSQIFDVLNNIDALNVTDDLKNYAYTEILAPQISEKFTTEQGKQLLEGVPMREAIRSYYMRDIINEEIDNDNTIHPLDKDDYKKIRWQNYLADNALEENMTFEQRENLRYFLANGQSNFEKTWDDYVYGGNEKERENIDALRNCGLDTLTYQVIKSGANAFESDKDSDGEPIKDSKKNKVINYLKQWNLTDEQYALMMKLQGYKVGSSSSSKKSSSKKSSKSSSSSPKVKGGFSGFKGF